MAAGNMYNGAEWPEAAKGCPDSPWSEYYRPLWSEDRVSGIEQATRADGQDALSYAWGGALSYMLCDGTRVVPAMWGIRWWTYEDDIGRILPEWDPKTRPNLETHKYIDIQNFRQTALDSNGKSGSWVTFRLWVADTGYKYDEPDEENTTFYYFLDHTLDNGSLLVAEYVEYRAKTHKQAIYFHNSHLFEESPDYDPDRTDKRTWTTEAGWSFSGAPAGTAPQGGSTFSEADRTRHADLKASVEPIPSNPESIRVWDGHVPGRKGNAVRLESVKAYNHSAMHEIANKARVAVPRVVAGSSEMAAGRATANINEQITIALSKAGYSNIQIGWYLQGGVSVPIGGHLGERREFGQYYGDDYPQRGDPVPFIPPEKVSAGSSETTGRGGGTAAIRAGGGSRGTGGSGGATVPTPTMTRIAVRTPYGYVAPADHNHTGDRAEIVQSYKAFLNGQMADKIERFQFPVTPNNISYSGLGSRWIEVPRKGYFPIVEWADWVLMKVQFDFLLAHEMDGLFNDVSEYIEQLRRMAQRPQPVSVYGLDQLFKLQIKRAQITGKAMQFVIADFSVKSVARTINHGDKEITSAQCSMTLQEITIEEMEIINMSIPPLAASAIPPGDDEDDPGPGKLSCSEGWEPLYDLEGCIPAIADGQQSSTPPVSSGGSRGTPQARYGTPDSRSTVATGRISSGPGR